MRLSFASLFPLALLAATASVQAPVAAAPVALPAAAHGGTFPPPGGMTKPSGPSRPAPNLPTGVPGGYRGPAGGGAAGKILDTTHLMNASIL